MRSVFYLSYHRTEFHAQIPSSKEGRADSEVVEGKAFRRQRGRAVSAPRHTPVRSQLQLAGGGSGPSRKVAMEPDAISHLPFLT